MIDTLIGLDPTLAGCVSRRGIPGLEPDFVFEAETGADGVEITEYFRPDTVEGSPLKEQESLTDLVTSRATALCRSAGLSNVLAIAEFDFSKRIRKEDTNALANHIKTVIAPVGRGDQKSIEVTGRRQLPAPLSRLWAYRRDEIEQPYVGREWGGTVPPIDEIHLVAAIRRKEQKLPIYRQRCSRVCLAILVDPYKVASMAYVPPAFGLSFSTFDHVVIVQGWAYTLDVWRRAAA